MQGTALWYVGPGRAELREEPVAAPAPGEVRVRALFGAISRGTERLVHAGRVPASEYDRMRAPLMGGTFPFPVKYGYATVGRVEAGPAELATASSSACIPTRACSPCRPRPRFPFPTDVPPRRAVLAANMETALNAVWDGAPGPADRIAVVGGGLVGLLVAYLCARLPGAEVTVVDIGVRARRARTRARRPLCGAGRRAGRLRSRLPRQRQRGRTCDRAAARRRGGEHRRAELVRQRRRRGAARRSVPQPAAAARLEPGRQGRAVASLALDARTAAGGGAGAARTTPCSTRLLAPALAFEDLPARLPAIFSPDSDVVCQLIRYAAASA